MKAVKVGNPFDNETMMGSMISKSHMESVDGFVKHAKASGANILCGGEILDGPGYFYAPTVINNLAQTSGYKKIHDTTDTDSGGTSFGRSPCKRIFLHSRAYPPK